MSGANAAYATMPAIPASPPRVGLLASALRPDTAPERWQNGIQIVPEDCIPGVGSEAEPPAWWCHDEVDGSPSDAMAWPMHPEPVFYRPWFARVGITCATTAFDAGDYQGRARRKYLASESRLIERELWSGRVAQAAGFPNRYLTQLDSVELLAEQPLTSALALLQLYLADRTHGRGMIHATPRTVSFWQHAGMLRREGNLILDVFDNIIVPGQGYYGSGPDTMQPLVPGVIEWAYATSMIVVLTEPSVTVIPDQPSEAIDRDRDRVAYQAGRVVAAFWDGCAHAAVPVNLCEMHCTPPGS